MAEPRGTKASRKKRQPPAPPPESGHIHDMNLALRGTKESLQVAEARMEIHAEHLVRLVGDAVANGRVTEEEAVKVECCFRAAIDESRRGADFGIAVQRAVARLCS